MLSVVPHVVVVALLLPTAEPALSSWTLLSFRAPFEPTTVFAIVTFGDVPPVKLVFELSVISVTAWLASAPANVQTTAVAGSDPPEQVTLPGAVDRHEGGLHRGGARVVGDRRP